METLVAFDAIVFEPVVMHMAKCPRVHASVGPGVTLWVRMDPHATVVPTTVYAVALCDDHAYYGTIPTDRIGIGPQNDQVTFKDVS